MGCVEALATAGQEGRLAVVEHHIPEVAPYLVFLVDTPDRSEKVHIAVHGVRPEDYGRPSVQLPLSEAANRYDAWYVERRPNEA